MRGAQGIAQNARTGEGLKAEMAASPGSVCKALLKGDPEMILDSLGGIVIREGHELDTWHGDLSQLRERFQGQRR